MHVTRVELENIKSYGAGEEGGSFSFERGTTAIVGENGAGKTTILEAVAWALFDVLDYSKDDFLRRGAKKGWVRVSFMSGADEREYLVYRDTGAGYYFYDTQLKQKLATGKADVRPLVNLHLGVEPGTDLKSLFRSAIGVPQGFFTTDFLRTPNERKAAFDRLLKVEEYRESADGLRETVNLIRERTAETRGRISGAESQLARFDEIVAEHERASARTKEIEGSLEGLRREAETRARAVAKLDEAERLANETRGARERLEVETLSAERRLKDSRGELEAARAARERQRATEEDYRAHVEATEKLRALETERSERERLLSESSSVERSAATAEADARRIEEALERVEEARASLANLKQEVSRQEEFERERERLRDLLAEARAASTRLANLEGELTNLRRQLIETRERVRAAERHADAQAKVDRLENDRMGVENRLNAVNESLTELRLLASQRRDLARETERLRKFVVELERESREYERTASEAARAPEAEARAEELRDRAAQLRASIRHDERVREETRGGVCPILGEQCESFSEGRTFDSYFGDKLERERARLASAEKELTQAEKLVALAREAERNLARFETARKRLADESSLLNEREKSLSVLDERIARLPEASEGLRTELQTEMLGIDLALKAARDEAMRFAELETLRKRLDEIEEEGKTKKEEREQLSATAGAVASLERDVRENEERLRALNDPRGRASALKVEIEREPSLKSEMKKSRERLDELEKRRGDLERSLSRFKGLDASLKEETARRERAAEGYREYLERASLAATLPAREREAKEAEESASDAARRLAKARETYERAAESYDREKHGEERGALSLARERIAANEAQREAAQEREASLREEIARLEEVRAAWREELRSIERLERVNETTDFVRDVLKQAGPLVTESYLYNISIDADQLFREITGDGGRALRWTKDYEIIVEEGGYERSFVNLSGGEQMVAALSVRLALLKQLSDIRVAFFDEPTVNMDAERRERLAQQIGQVKHLDQLFVISHDDTFEETVDHVVTVSRAVAAVGA